MAEIKKIDHVGVLVLDMDEAIGKYEGLLARGPSHVESFGPAKLQIAFFDVGGVQVELIAPTEPGSEYWNVVRERGEGLHHICYEVDDLEEILEGLKRKGFELIDQKPRPGSRGTSIAFVEAQSAGGVLTEYCEFPKENVTHP